MSRQAQFVSVAAAMLAAFAIAGCHAGNGEEPREIAMTAKSGPATGGETKGSGGGGPPAAEEIATLGAGCYWCVEAVLQQVDGVLGVKSGFMGGTVANPSYRAVCGGDTGHAEVVQVRFDPKKLPYEHLLAWFWKLHDPTQLNRQGNDEGTQYRSVIFWHSEAQRVAAEKSKAEAQKSGEHAGTIVTEIAKAGTFYPADDYHQDYYRQNRAQSYCRFVIAPKLEKLGLEK